VILGTRGDEVVDRPMTEYDASLLNPTQLARLEEAAPSGFAVRAVTPEGVLACTATSYTVSSRHLEVAIATRPAFAAAASPPSSVRP
jgi:hypothetical protein